MKEQFFLKGLIENFESECERLNLGFQHLNDLDALNNDYFNFTEMKKGKHLNDCVSDDLIKTNKNVIFIFDIGRYNNCYVLEEMQKVLEFIFEHYKDEKTIKFIENTKFVYIDNLDIFNEIVRPVLIQKLSFKEIFKNYSDIIPTILFLHKNNNDWDIECAAEDTFFLLKKEMILDIIDELVYNK